MNLRVLRRVSILSGALSVFSACSSSPDYGDAPDGAASQISLSVPVGPPEAELIVVVLDDQPGADDLRQVATFQLESYASRSLSEAPPCLPNDPARERPIDRSLVVVYPSTSGDARFVSPANDPNLRWRESNASLGGRLTWVTALDTALAPSHEGAPFAPLAAMKSLVDLVTYARSAQTPAESALVASVPKPSVLRLLLLSAHEDDSSGEPSDYVVSLQAPAQFDTVLLPRATPLDSPATCGVGSALATPRFSAWQALQSPPSTNNWPCDGLVLLTSPKFDCVSRCVNWRPTEETDGRATCLLTVDAAVDHCDPAVGWLDPLAEDGVRRPVRTTSATGVVSTCEIQQLTGAALESCRSTLACSGCEPGWCATKVPELLDDCTLGVPLPLRFSGGADVVAPGVGTLLCNVERVSSD